MVAPVAVLDGIGKSYPGAKPVHALRHTELRIDQGDFVTITGPSGSGKSTLLSILGLLDHPTEGTYELNGVETTRMTEAERAAVRAEQLGFVFQSFHLLEHRSILENVELGLTYQGARRPARRRAALEVLEQVGLGDRHADKPTSLSGGERQRVAIARALVRKPAIVLCDEPTGNLDTETGRRVLALVQGLHERGETVVLITHDPSVAVLGTRRFEIRDGVVREAGRAA